jgi:hypothetical protein
MSLIDRLVFCFIFNCSVKSVETDPQIRAAVGGGGRVASSSWRTMPSIIESSLVLLGVAMAALSHVF